MPLVGFQEGSAVLGRQVGPDDAVDSSRRGRPPSGERVTGRRRLHWRRRRRFGPVDRRRIARRLVPLAAPWTARRSSVPSAVGSEKRHADLDHVQ